MNRTKKQILSPVLSVALPLASLFYVGFVQAANVLIIDEGADLEHQGLKTHVNRNKAGCSGEAISNDSTYDFTGACVGWNEGSNDPVYLSPKIRQYFADNTVKISGLFAQIEKAMDGDKASRDSLKGDPETLELIEQLMGLAHGSHVAGITVRASQNTAKLQSFNVFTKSDAEVKTASTSLAARSDIAPTTDKSNSNTFQDLIKRFNNAAALFRVIVLKHSVFDEATIINSFLDSEIDKSDKETGMMSHYIAASHAKVANLSLGMSHIAIEGAGESIWQADVQRRGLDPKTAKRTPSQQAGFDKLVEGIYSIHGQSWKKAFAENPDVLFVVAAGNDGNPKKDNAGNNDVHPVLPANLSGELPNVISVAATDDNGALLDFSNYSDTLVNVGAPGHDIKSYAPANMTVVMSGTSMASPYVAGVAARLRTVNPKLSAADTRRILEQTARPTESLRGKTTSGGMIDPEAALSAAMNNAPSEAFNLLGANDSGDKFESLPGLSLPGAGSVVSDMTHVGELAATSDLEKDIASALMNR